MAEVTGRIYGPGGTVRPIIIQQRVSPQPVPSPSPVPGPSSPNQEIIVRDQPSPEDSSSRAWWNTPEGRRQVIDETARRYPNAPYVSYKEAGGYFWGVTASGMQERLNPATASTIPNPYAAARGPGVGAKIPDRASPYTSFSLEAPTKKGIQAIAEARASQERAAYNLSIPAGMTWSEIQAGYSPGSRQAREQEIYTSMVRGPTERTRAIEAAYQQQRGNIVGSSGVLAPLGSGKYLQVIGLSRDTGKIFAPTEITQQITGGQQQQTIRQDWGNIFRGIPILEQAADLGHRIGDDNPAIRQTTRDILTGINSVPDTIVGAYDRAQTRAGGYVQKVLPEPNPESIKWLKNYGQFILPLNMVMQNPITREIAVDLAAGEITGWRERPIEAAAYTALSFALPGVMKGTQQAMRASPTITRMAAHPVGRYIVGEVPSIVSRTRTPTEISNIARLTGRSVPETASILAQGDAAIRQSTRYFNPLTSGIASVLGITYTQSVIERITGTEKEMKTSSSTPGGSRSWSEGSKLFTETWGPTTIERSELVNVPAIPARLQYDQEKGGLAWGARPDLLPSRSQMTQKAGEIIGVEIAPTVAGFMAGMWFWPKASGWLRSRGTPGIPIEEIGYERQYPISQRITEQSIERSFRESTLYPGPSEMRPSRTGSTRVPYVPERAALPGEDPSRVYMWTGWERQPSRSFALQAGSSEIEGMYGAPVAEAYFSKPRIGMGDYKLFGLDLPRFNDPTLIRTEARAIESIPRGLRSKSQYPNINQWMQTRGRGETIYTPLIKAEYEGVLPAITSEGTTILEVTGKPYHTTVQGVRVPILQVRAGTRAGLLPELGIGSRGQMPGPAEVIMPGRGVGFIQGGPGPGGGPGAGGAGRIWSSPSMERWYLSNVPRYNRQTAEALLEVGRGIEGMRAPYERPLQLSEVQLLRGYDRRVAEVLGRHQHVIIGSSIRTGQMEAGQIRSTFGRMPRDIDAMFTDTGAVARDLSRVLPRSQFRVQPTFRGRYKVERRIPGGWETAIDIHPLAAVRHNNPLGWQPTARARITQGSTTYEPLFQQVQREIYGAMIGRPTRGGGWQFGPRPARTEKDIKGLLYDVDYLLSAERSQRGITPQYQRVQAAMRTVKRDPMVQDVIRSNRITTENYAGIPLGKGLSRPRGLRDLEAGERVTLGEMRSLMASEYEASRPALINPVQLGIGYGLVQAATSLTRPGSGRPVMETTQAPESYSPERITSTVTGSEPPTMEYQPPTERGRYYPDKALGKSFFSDAGESVIYQPGSGSLGESEISSRVLSGRESTLSRVISGSEISRGDYSQGSESLSGKSISKLDYSRGIESLSGKSISKSDYSEGVEYLSGKSISRGGSSGGRSEWSGSISLSELFSGISSSSKLITTTTTTTTSSSSRRKKIKYDRTELGIPRKRKDRGHFPFMELTPVWSPKDYMKITGRLGLKLW
jgi:hypothetical protein